MNKNIFAIIVSAALLAGCAAIRAQNCTENAGYQKGMNDARAGRLMSLQNYAVVCDKDGRELAEKGYKDGYQAGQNNGGAQLNVTLKGGKLGLVGAYSCVAAYGGGSYKADASTEAEARAKALEECRGKHPSCDETAVTCSKN